MAVYPTNTNNVVDDGFFTIAVHDLNTNIVDFKCPVTFNGSSGGSGSAGTSGSSGTSGGGSQNLLDTLALGNDVGTYSILGIGTDGAGDTYPEVNLVNLSTNGFDLYTGYTSSNNQGALTTNIYATSSDAWSNIHQSPGYFYVARSNQTSSSVFEAYDNGLNITQTGTDGTQTYLQLDSFGVFGIYGTDLQINGLSGVSATYSTGEGQIVTVTNGIITSIV